jgi:hypothetical protein
MEQVSEALTEELVLGRQVVSPRTPEAITRFISAAQGAIVPWLRPFGLG